MKRRLEHQHQVALFQWAKMMSSKYPELQLLFAIPNESFGSNKWAIIRMKYLKAEGLKPGVPDVFLPVPRGGFHGLFIEMKVGKRKPTEKQRWWIENLKKQGYKVEVCYSFQEARDLLLEYLGIE